MVGRCNDCVVGLCFVCQEDGLLCVRVVYCVLGWFIAR